MLNVIKKLKNWCPQPKSPSQSNVRNQNTVMLNIGSFSAKIAMTMRLAYGMALIAVLFTPFGVYHSRVEPYIVGSLWGYNLPIGYIGLTLGMLALVFPKTILAKKSSLGTAMIITGILLIGSLYLVPKESFINWINGTNFSGSQIDIDFAIGNAVTLFMGMFGIIAGLVARISVYSFKKNNVRI